jgi:hypothetical protein
VGPTPEADALPTGGCHMRQSQQTRRRRTSKAMSLEELEDWIDHLDPSPLVDSVSMLDGYLAAIMAAACFNAVSEGVATTPDRYAAIFE